MNLSPIISKTIPEFVNDDYPLFVQFIKTYYKWLDETQITSIENIVDIDETLDSFIKYFRAELDVYGIKYQYIDERIYLKYVKQFYLSKGSEAAYWFLFRILFNTDSAIIRPWDYTFIPSMAQWTQDISIFVNILYGDGNDLKQNKIIIIGDDEKEYGGRVKDVVQIGYNEFELFLDKKITGNIVPYNRVKSSDNSVLGVLEPVISRLVIETPGNSFMVGDVYDIDTYNGTGTKILIQEIDDNGGIKTASIINFGTGYTTEFNYTLFPITTQEFIYPDYNFIINDGEIKYNSQDIVTDIVDGGNIVKHNYATTPTDYFTDITYVGKNVRSFSDINTSTPNTTNAASIRFYIDYTCKYPGYYLNKYNVLGQPVYLEDSYYYQIYSYVTSLDVPLHKYKSLINNAIHPIGNKLFSNYIPVSDIYQSISIVDDLLVYRTAPEFIEYINAVDDEFIIDRTVHYSAQINFVDNYIIFIGDTTLFFDSYAVNDVNYNHITKTIADDIQFIDNVSVTRLFTDLPEVTEIITKTITKKPRDTVGFSDSIRKEYGLTIPATYVMPNDNNVEGELEAIQVYKYAYITTNESVAAAEEFTKNPTKYFYESLNITNTVGGYYGTLYVEQTPIYWDLTYYDKEFSVTV